MAEVDPIFAKLDQLISASRLRELGIILSMDRIERVGRIMAALSRLKPGAYLLGTGPSTVGIIPLTVEEIVLGRAATPVEEPAEAVIDYAVADTLYYGPLETSRTHAKIVRQNKPSRADYWVVDLGSSRGTFLNGQPVDQQGQMLVAGDVISLGPSHISTYLFYVASSSPQAPENLSGDMS